MPRTIALALGLVLCSSLATAQLTLANTGTTVPPASVTSTGTLHVLETTNPANIQVGAGSIQRLLGNANTSYIPTSWAINPAGATGPSGENGGFTIQFWHKPIPQVNIGLAEYFLGDSAWVGVNGAFRVFANGIAGAGNIIVRGPLTEVATTTTPLTTGLNANGWVFLALVHDSVANTLAWYVNGTVAGLVATSITGTGTNLSIVGYNGSASPGPEGWTDDFRGYTYARTPTQIMNDFTLGSLNGPATGIDIPNYYFEFEAPQNAHTGVIGTNGDSVDLVNRLFTTGTFIEWGGDSPQIDPPATAVINLEGPSFGTAGYTARPLAYGAAPPMNVTYSTTTPISIPGMELGHNFSSPVNPIALAWPDGLLLGPLLNVVAVSIPVPYMYSSPNTSLVMPPGIFQPGDAIHIQFLAPDTTFPNSAATTNRTTFLYVDPDLSMNANGTAAEHVHIEARGVNPIQNVGFWEVWNTGLDSITQVTIDFSTIPTATTWAPAGLLNTGGMLSTLNSFRHNTEIYTGLNLGTVGPLTGTPSALTFDFTSFDGVIDHFVFDCSTAPTPTGAGFVGATVTVTFMGGTVLTGQLVADPADPMAAQVDL